MQEIPSPFEASQTRDKPQRAETLCPALVSFYNLPLSERERQQVSECTHKAQLDEEWASHAEGGSSALRLSLSWGRAL